MRLITLVIAATGLLALFSADVAPSAPGESVTLNIVRFYDQPTRSYRLRFSGVISSGASGEDVTVVQQTCGYTFATAVAGAQTRDGGAWDAEPANWSIIAQSATYRARWKHMESGPVTIRSRIPVFFFPSTRGVWRASVSIGSVKQDMRGRFVLLQRRLKDSWKTIERKRFVLGPAGGAGFSYVASFRIRKRGWTVRAFVPAKSAGPCFTASVTEKQKT